MFSTKSGFRWQNSKAHLLLLSYFLHPRSIREFANEKWNTVLREKPDQAIKRLQQEGLLIEAELAEHLSYKYKVVELKQLLKERALPVSGKKEDMIRRVIQANLEDAKRLVAGLFVLKCSENGRAVAEAFVLAEKEEKNKVEQVVFDHLRNRKLEDACRATALFEAGQVFPRGLGIDWINYNPENDTAILKSIFDDQPKILRQITPQKMESFRIAAGMMHLWGVNSAEKWLAQDFRTDLSFDNDTATRMLLFFARHKVNLINYRKSGSFKYVEILTTQDSCDECRKNAKKRYKLDEVLELPNEHCLHTKGCRCTYIPIFLA